jgi:uncharacterized repeat protein (TIGR01451 family)
MKSITAALLVILLACAAGGCAAEGPSTQKLLNVSAFINGTGVVVAKTVYPTRVNPGDRVNVTVTITNIGTETIYNVTAIDIRPRETYLVSGRINGYFDPLLKGDIYRYHYTILAPSPGEYHSWPGRMQYQDRNGTLRTAAIEATDFIVLKPEPDVHSAKSVSPELVFVGSQAAVRLEFVNNGTDAAYDIEVTDYVPSGFNVSSGEARFRIPALPAGQNTTREYNMTPMEKGMHSTKALFSYADGEGARQNRSTNVVRVESADKLHQEVSSSNPVLILALVVGAIVVLYLIYRRINA